MLVPAVQTLRALPTCAPAAAPTNGRRRRTTLRRDGQPTAEVTGYSPQVLAAALQGSRFNVRAELLPFARCLADARAGRTMQIVMAAFHNPQRAEAFFYSQPYLTLMPRAYFLAEQWPKGLNLSLARRPGRPAGCAG